MSNHKLETRLSRAMDFLCRLVGRLDESDINNINISNSPEGVVWVMVGLTSKKSLAKLYLSTA